MLESSLNVVGGFSIGVIAQIVIFPVFNIHLEHSTNFKIAMAFSVVSFVRSYYFRRMFNWLHTEGFLVNGK